jgi:hypothetical protein
MISFWWIVFGYDADDAISVEAKKAKAGTLLIKGE